MADRWFEYDWQIEGIDAEYAVDVGLIEHTQPEAAPYLFYISCMTESGEPLSVLQQRRIAAMIKKCEKVLPLYAGRICTPDHHQFYFYGADKAAQKELSALCKKQRRLICRCGRVNDPEWRTYLELLYPDTAKYQTEMNRRSIERYEKKGDGLTTPRRVNLYCYFPTEPLLVQFSEDARLSGFALGKHEYAPETDLPYGIPIHIISSLEKRVVDRLTTRVIQIAARYDGKLTHWDTQLVYKRAPMT